MDSSALREKPRDRRAFRLAGFAPWSYNRARVEDQKRNDPNLGVYAAAAAFLAGLPIPVLDGLLSDTARGAAFRRVAAGRGVRLSSEARRALVATSYLPSQPRGRVIARAARSIAQRVFLPARVATRLEMAARALVETRLLDAYFRTADRREGAPFGASEAARVRAAMDEALRVGLSGVRDALAARFKDLAASIRRGEPGDDRAAFERVIDTLLDFSADLPADAVAPIEARFLDALGGLGS